MNIIYSRKLQSSVVEKYTMYPITGSGFQTEIKKAEGGRDLQAGLRRAQDSY